MAALVLPLQNIVLYYAVVPSHLDHIVVGRRVAVKTEATTKTEAPAKKEEDDFDLFGGDEEDDAEYEAELEKRRKAAEDAKGGPKKKDVVAKSSLLIDVKPWDDETPMEKLEESVRSIVIEGLTWGASKFVPVGYGIKKLQIAAVIVDALVSVDDLEEQVTGFEDYVQSMDIAAFNKI